MALLATTLAHDAARAIKTETRATPKQLVSVEEEVRRLHRQIFERLFAQDWPHGVQPAVDAALMDRYYARFADHAAAIAHQASFIVTGSPPSGEHHDGRPNRVDQPIPAAHSTASVRQISRGEASLRVPLPSDPLGSIADARRALPHRHR